MPHLGCSRDKRTLQERLMTKTIKLILKNLDACQRRDMRRVVMFAFCSALLELVTVASLYPITRLAFLGDLPEGLVADIPAVFGLTTLRSVGLFWAGFTLATVFVSLIVRLIALYIQTKFVQTVRHTISLRLFTAYMSQPYTFFLRHHSSELTKNTLQEVDHFSVSGVNALISFAVSLGTILATLELMFLFAPGPTLIFVFAAIVLYVLFYLGVARRNVRAALERFNANKTRNFVVSESFAMFKEVKANNSEAFFLKTFEPASLMFSKSMIVFDIFANLPRYFIETLLFGGVAGAIGFAFLTMGENVTLSNALPTIAVAMGATVRILPASQTLYRNLNSLRHCAPAVQSIDQVLALRTQQFTVKHSQEVMSFQTDIVFDAVSFQHDGADRPALADVTVRIPRGAHVGIVGETGSGKSTFLDALMGLLEPTDGAIYVDGTRLESDRLAAWRGNIGYVPQQVVLTDGTIAQNIALGMEDEDIDLERVAHAARIAQAAEFIEKLPAGFHAQVGERGVQLSGGQRQRLSIARALYKDPEVLIFDEATSALDQDTERRVVNAIRKSAANSTLIMVAHRQETLAGCDQRIELSEGRLINRF